MKKVKKMLALLLAMAMLLGLSATALADDSATITVKNIDAEEGGEEAELSYLQIIVQDQTTRTGWSFASEAIEEVYLAGYNGEDGSLTAQEVIESLIAAEKASTNGYANSDAIGRALSKVAALDGFVEMENPQTVTSAGVYAVKAAQEGYTYNNMAAYVGFGEATDGTYPVLQDAELNAKRVKIGLDKSHDDEDKVSAIGKVVTYTITTNVPYINPEATLVGKTYFIHDEIIGAEYVLEGDNVKGTVTLAGNPLDVDIKPTTPEEATADNAFYIDLSHLIDDQNSKAGQEIVVTYEAKVTAVEVDNTAKAGHKDGETFGAEYGEDDEELYTGQITLTKTGEEDGEKLADAGFEVTDENEAVVYFTKTDEGVYNHIETADVPAEVKAKLDDAADKKSVLKAELEVTEAGITYVRQIFTKDSENEDEKGTVLVQGLDVGTYTFTEKTAPKGYSVNEEPAVAEIKITKDVNGSDATGTLVATEVIKQTTSMTDTRMSALPATGGIGTTIFTIGGCAIMIIAAGLYFASRRKRVK